MKTTRFLSQEEKHEGLKYHLWHQRFNGVGFNFIGDTSVSLLAIHFGASNVQLGYLASVLYLSGILLIIVPRLFAGRNYSQMVFWTWLIRGLTCLAYSALWFVSGNTAVLIILITYTMFCSIRIIGAAFYQPILRMISTSQNRGEVVARSSINFQMALTFSRLISFFITSLQQLSGITGVLFLQYPGIIFNSIAAFAARKVPCRETVRYKRGENLWKIFRSAMKQRDLRIAAVLNWLAVAMLILFGFQIPFLRREAGLSTSEIFLYTIIAAISYIAAGYYTKAFADRLGSRALLLAGSVIIGAASLFWGFLPPETSIYPILLLGFVTGFFLSANSILIGRVLLGVLPEKDTVGYNSMINFVIALISLGIGTGGGYLADSQARWNLNLSNEYSLTFAMAFICSVAAVFLCLKLREPETWSGREVMGILFSPTNLQTFWQIGRLNRETDPVARKTLLLNIGKKENPLTTSEIRSIMANPLSADKDEIVKTLFSFPRKELLGDLMREAENPSSRCRVEAVFALGAYPDAGSRRLLEKLLVDRDPEIRSNAAKSLGRINAESNLETISEQAAGAEGIWNRMNYIIALKNLDKKGIYLRDAFALKILKENRLHRQTIYSLYAKVLEFSPGLEEIYRLRNLKKGTGLGDFLDETRDIAGFLENHKDFNSLFADNDAAAVCRRCMSMLEGTQVRHDLKYLSESIRNINPDDVDYDDALAILYFTYHLLKRIG